MSLAQQTDTYPVPATAGRVCIKHSTDDRSVSRQGGSPASHRQSTNMPRLGFLSAKLTTTNKADKSFAGSKKISVKSAGASPSLMHLPYFWKRSDSVLSESPPPKQAPDRMYNSMHYDRLNPSLTQLRVQVEMPLLHQKSGSRIWHPVTGVNNADSNVKSSTLSPELVTKIYNQLHHDPQDKSKRCMYVINNKRSASALSSAAKSPRGLPNVIPMYHIRLAKSIKKITAESIAGMKSQVESEKPLEPQVVPKPTSAITRVRSSRPKIPITRRSATKQTDRRDDLEISDYLTSSSGVFKSAEAYNRLLAARQKERRDRSASLRQQKEKEKEKKQGHEQTRMKRLRGLSMVPTQEAESAPIDFITAVSISRKTT